MSTAAAPRIDPRLLRIIEQRVHERAAELTRVIGDVAESLGLARPSYEQVRVLRRRAELLRGSVTTADILFDIAVRARPAYDLANWWDGDPLPWRAAAKNERPPRN